MRYYYKDNKGNLYNLKERVNDNTYTEITEQEFNELQDSIPEQLEQLIKELKERED